MNVCMFFINVCVYIDICTYIHIYTPTSIHTHTHTHTHSQMYVFNMGEQVIICPWEKYLCMLAIMEDVDLLLMIPKGF
jgi:hypothetical protein